MRISRYVDKRLVCNAIRNPLVTHQNDLRGWIFRVIGQHLFHCQRELRDLKFHTFRI
jgi:hypothetical protein